MTPILRRLFRPRDRCTTENGCLLPRPPNNQNNNKTYRNQHKRSKMYPYFAIPTRRARTYSTTSHVWFSWGRVVVVAYAQRCGTDVEILREQTPTPTPESNPIVARGPCRKHRGRIRVRPQPFHRRAHAPSSGTHTYPRPPEAGSSTLTPDNSDLFSFFSLFSPPPFVRSSFLSIRLRFGAPLLVFS